MKDELGVKIMTEFATLRSKKYSYLMSDGNSHTKPKGTKKCVIKRILKFNDYKNCLLSDEITLKPQPRFKSEAHNVYTEEINNDHKRAAMIIRDCKLLIELHHIHIVQVLEKYAKDSY